MNLTQLKERVLNVMMSTNDQAKRQETRIITSASQRSTASPGPGPGQHSANTDANKSNPGSSPLPTEAKSKYAEIQSRTMTLLNVPDTVNEARIRALAEPYGELVKVSLRLDHQGVILEYKDVTSVGKASLGLEGHEIAPERHIRVGNVNDLKQQKGEHRSDKAAVGGAAKLQGQAPIRRPNQPGSRRGGKGGLGVKRAGAGGLSADSSGDSKSNADFKAMFLAKEGQ